VNFLVPEAVRLTILEHIGLHQVRENTKMFFGIFDSLHLLETFVRRATNRWTVLYRPGLTLRVPEPKKACFSVRDKLFAFNILPRLEPFRSPGLGFMPSYSMTQVDFYRSTSCTRDSYLDGRGL
jgi:hypothetical protein